MSGIRGFSEAISGVGRNALDVPVAALAALAVAFVAFSIPPEPLADLIAATGLPQWLPAAEPPLGAKARTGLGLVGAILVFALVFGLLRLLDRTSSRPAPRTVEAPRLRRRDSHPDAPSRRPISASLEFGEPGLSEARPAPAWLSPAELAFDEESIDQADAAERAPDEEAEAVPFEPTPQARPAIDDPVEDWPAEACPAEPWPAEPWPAKTGSGDRVGGETIAELIERLEQGLARRQTDPSAVIRQAIRATAEPAIPADGDDRLQSAIDSLQRLASRQG